MSVLDPSDGLISESLEKSLCLLPIFDLPRLAESGVNEVRSPGEQTASRPRVHLLLSYARISTGSQSLSRDWKNDDPS